MRETEAAPYYRMVPARLHLSADALVVQLLFPRLLSRVTLLSHWQRQLARSNRGHARSSSKRDIIITCLRLCFLASLRRLSLRCKVNWLESAVEFSSAPHGSNMMQAAMRYTANTTPTLANPVTKLPILSGSNLTSNLQTRDSPCQHENNMAPWQSKRVYALVRSAHWSPPIHRRFDLFLLRLLSHRAKQYLLSNVETLAVNSSGDLAFIEQLLSPAARACCCYPCVGR